MNAARVFATEGEYREYARREVALHSFTFGDWQFDYTSGRVGDVQLSVIEAGLLYVLAEVAPMTLTIDQISKRIKVRTRWEPDPNEIKVYIRRLRMKIGTDRIENLRGHGYRFVAFPED